jgi:hypothetical protein
MAVAAPASALEATATVRPGQLPGGIQWPTHCCPEIKAQVTVGSFGGTTPGQPPGGIQIPTTCCPDVKAQVTVELAQPPAFAQ